MKARLLQERDALIRQRDAIENQIAGLEMALSLIEADAAPPAGKSGKRTATKTVVLDLLRDVGTRGINAQAAVDLADARGVTLDKGSVSSLLSRLKKDDVVVYDGSLYRLREFAPKEHAPSPVHAFPKPAVA